MGFPVVDAFEITARPAGYGMAVCGGVFRSAIAAFFPGAIGCGAMGMKRSALTFPREKPYIAMPLPRSPALSPRGSVTEPTDAKRRFPSELNAKPMK